MYISIPPRAVESRETTLSMEMIQNHVKWYYLTILPLLSDEVDYMPALEASRLCAEVISLLAGQYPHNSYAVEGGITSRPTPADIFSALERIERLKKLFITNFVDTEGVSLPSCEKVENILSLEGTLPTMLRIVFENGWEKLGRSHDRFMVFGENSLFRRGKSTGTRIYGVPDVKFVEESRVQGSEAGLVRYRDKYYETGPLARAMMNRTSLVRDAHRRYGDSLLSRILARVCEIPSLLEYAEETLMNLDIDSPSFEEPPPFPTEASGMGVVEAARGSLIHRISVENGKISRYDIVTPTQWNLGNGTRDEPSVVQRALKGVDENGPLELIFKSFDVCSVCTTH
jgi:hydrogenase large subunit